LFAVNGVIRKFRKKNTRSVFKKFVLFKKTVQKSSYSNWGVAS